MNIRTDSFYRHSKRCYIATPTVVTDERIIYDVFETRDGKEVRIQSNFCRSRTAFEAEYK